MIEEHREVKEMFFNFEIAKEIKEFMDKIDPGTEIQEGSLPIV